MARFNSRIIVILSPAVDNDVHWAVQARPKGPSENVSVVVPVFAKVSTFAANRA